MTPTQQEYREITLTQGQAAVVDVLDYDDLDKRNWCAHWNEDTKSFYAVRNSSKVNGRSHTVYMHREILGMKFGDGREGDHFDGDTLNNRRLNLREATHSQNKMNTFKPSTNTSGYKGVTLNKNRGKWQAQIKIQGKYKYLGLFGKAEDAYAAYCRAATEHQGEFAKLPQPIGG